MNPANSQASMERIADILGFVRKKGIRLWSENGQLRYQAPKGALTQDEIQKLRTSKNQIVAILERATAVGTAESRFEPYPRPDRAPLAFSQLAHWRANRLSERHGIRQVASATRLCGRLNIDAFRKSVAEIVRRHDALRTRIVVFDGSPAQEVVTCDDCQFEVADLTEVAECSRELEVMRLIDQLILEPIDIAVGPLLGVRLIRLRHDEHVLVLAMEHIISDGFSLNILARDLFAAYIQVLKGRDLSLPTIPIQFVDYAVWQSNAQKSWVEKHGAYWNERLAGCQRLKFPEDKSLTSANRLGWGTVRLQLERNLKGALREWCRLRQTTLVMCLFTAYVALVLRWCNASESVILYQSDGRISPEMENTIGFFASVLYVRVALHEDDSFVDLLHRVTMEYCTAYEHADYSFISAQVPRPEFTRNAGFNWLPQGSFRVDLSDLVDSDDAIKCSPIHFAHPMLSTLNLDQEPGLGLYEADDEIVGDLYFPLSRFSVVTMERFGRGFLVIIRALLKHPEGRLKGILLL